MSAISAARWRQLRTHVDVHGPKSLQGVIAAGMVRHRRRQSQGNSAVPESSAVHLPEPEISYHPVDPNKKVVETHRLQQRSSRSHPLHRKSRITSWRA